ncbi:hypothetical protein [Pseudomonas chlororaphis]|uniref:hypothetical protein n=1 Tax=Pseudomonas chlororaphis TaxID=587753 RepID=UPI0006849287|nr:hypothetical protein [Pseudomonas chlororaphis]
MAPGTTSHGDNDSRDKAPRAKLTKQNGTKPQEINDELQKMDLSTASKDLPDEYQSIDQRLKELGAAEKKADN